MKPTNACGVIHSKYKRQLSTLTGCILFRCVLFVFVYCLLDTKSRCAKSTDEYLGEMVAVYGPAS